MIACNVTLMIACNVTFDGEFSKSHQPTSIAQLLKCQVCQVSLKVAPTTRLSRQRIRHSTAQHSIPQHSTNIQHSTAQHSTARTPQTFSTAQTAQTAQTARHIHHEHSAQHSTAQTARHIRFWSYFSQLESACSQAQKLLSNASQVLPCLQLAGSEY